MKVRAKDFNYEGLSAGKYYEVISDLKTIYDVRTDFGDVKAFFKWRFDELEVEPESTPKDLASHIVKKLFELGNEGGKTTNRIAFMVGVYGVDEESAGGMNESALIRFLERTIKEFKGENDA